MIDYNVYPELAAAGDSWALPLEGFGDRVLETGLWKQGFGDRVLETGLWRQGFGDRALETGRLWTGKTRYFLRLVLSSEIV